MFERFTDRARRVVVLAQEEARLLNHNYIGTEHILLGLIHAGEGVAAKALESLGISLEGVRGQVEELIGQGGSSPSGHIPFTPRFKSESKGDLDYVGIVDSETFTPLNLLNDLGEQVRILIACKFGNARLIDNIGVVVPET